MAVISASFYERKVPLITAHRGSMWYMPEHTYPAYYYAFFEGADFIDVDLQPTKDGQFIVYHDPVLLDKEISGLDIFPKDQQISQEFINKVNNKTFEKGNGYFTKDFSTTDLKKLKHKMRYSIDELSPLPGTDLGQRPGFFDSQFEMLTLDDVITFI